MGTSRDLGGQVLKCWKNKKYTFPKNLSFCSLKLLVMILFEGISCYHLTDVAIEERAYKIFFSGDKVSFFMVNIANFVNYFIFS